MIVGERKSLQGEGDTRYETVTEERKRTHDKHDKDHIASQTHQTHMVKRGVSASSRVRTGGRMAWYSCNQIIGQEWWEVELVCMVRKGRLVHIKGIELFINISLPAYIIFPPPSDALEHRHAIRRSTSHETVVLPQAFLPDKGNTRPSTNRHLGSPSSPITSTGSTFEIFPSL